jgi:tetratricopeptide (TPR) repeat protein
MPVPPALLSSGEPFDGHHILSEAQSPVGIVLWQGVRDIVLWASTPLAQRANLFAETAYAQRLAYLNSVELEQNARRWLALLADVLSTADQPTSAEAAKLCRKLSRWAEERLLPKTAAWYAQAAALALPTHADHALAVASVLRRNGDYLRAETWYRRAIGIARRRRDAQAYASSYLGVGNLFMLRAEYEKAKFAFNRAFKTA